MRQYGMVWENGTGALKVVVLVAKDWQMAWKEGGGGLWNAGCFRR